MQDTTLSFSNYRPHPSHWSHLSHALLHPSAWKNPIKTVKIASKKHLYVKGYTMLEIRCPTCKKVLPEGLETRTFPFCSQRCKMVDLGRWLDEDYTISEPLEQSPHDKESPPEPEPV
jgi:hypothetical protein